MNIDDALTQRIRALQNQFEKRAARPISRGERTAMRQGLQAWPQWEDIKRNISRMYQNPSETSKYWQGALSGLRDVVKTIPQKTRLPGIGSFSPREHLSRAIKRRYPITKNVNFADIGRWGEEDISELSGLMSALTRQGAMQIPGYLHGGKGHSPVESAASQIGQVGREAKQYLSWNIPRQVGEVATHAVPSSMQRKLLAKAIENPEMARYITPLVNAYGRVSQGTYTRPLMDLLPAAGAAKGLKDISTATSSAGTLGGASNWIGPAGVAALGLHMGRYELDPEYRRKADIGSPDVPYTTAWWDRLLRPKKGLVEQVTGRPTREHIRNAIRESNRRLRETSEEASRQKIYPWPGMP